MENAYWVYGKGSDGTIHADSVLAVSPEAAEEKFIYQFMNLDGSFSVEFENVTARPETANPIVWH